jgi:hypothetical protein
MRREGDGDAVKTKEPGRRRGTPGPKQGKKQKSAHVKPSVPGDQVPEKYHWLPGMPNLRMTQYKL